MRSEFVIGLVFVQGKVNGAGPLWLALDTGASCNTLAPSLAVKLGLKAKGVISQAGIANDEVQKSDVFNNVEIRLDALTLHDQTIVSLPVEYVATQAGHPTDGIISISSFKNSIVEINYDTEQVRVEDSARYCAPKGYESIPIQLNHDVPFVEAELESFSGEKFKGTFLLDSGLTGAIILSKSFLDAHPMLVSGKLISPPEVTAVGGKIQYKLGRIASFKMGSFVLERPLTSFSVRSDGLPADIQIAGIIGAGILNRFHVVFDYSNRKLLLAPGEKFQEPFEAGMSGIVFAAESPDYRRPFVSGIYAESPAADAGLKAGDRLVTINREPAPTLAKLKALFDRPDMDYVLTIERGGRVMPMFIKTRRLI